MTADDSARDKPSETQRPEKGSDSGFRSRGQHNFALRYRGRDLPLLKSELVIGRSEACDFVIDGPLISRRHARLVITEQSVVVEDLGSRNGVFVNSLQIGRPVLLEPGDVVMIGDESFELATRRASPRSGRITASDPRAAVSALKSPRAPRIDLDEDAPTRGSDAFDLLRGVVDKAFAVGRPDEAERVLRAPLESLLEQARAGLHPPAGLCHTAASYAAKLAATIGTAKYLNYPIELYHQLAAPLPVSVVDELYPLIRRVQGFDRALLRRYVALLRSRAAHLGAAERFALQRIESLERLAAL